MTEPLTTATFLAMGLRAAGCWALTLALGLLGGCGRAEQEACTDLSCICPGTHFEYTGTCVDGQRVCECPDAPARELSCSFEPCTKSYGSVDGMWRLAHACPRELAKTATCSHVSETSDLEVEGLLRVGDSSANLRVTGTLVSDQGPTCGTSCAAIEMSLADAEASCEPGEDGHACRCTRPYGLAGGQAQVLADELLLFWPNGELFQAQYCQEGDYLTVSAPELDLRFERASCLPGQRMCEGHAIRECGPDGELLPLEPCQVGELCWESECRPRCMPGVLYCDEQGERRCSTRQVRLDYDPGEACPTGETCIDGSGCSGTRELMLGANLNSGSLSNVAFAGAVIEVVADATLTDYGFELNSYDPSTNLDWQVYEATTKTGPFTLVYSGTSEQGPGAGEQSSPAFELPLLKGRFYLLGVGVPASVILIAGVTAPANAFASNAGILYLQAPPGDGFMVLDLDTMTQALVGRAHLLAGLP